MWLCWPGLAEATFQMVVHETGCLQEGVADGRTEESESPFFHIPAHGFRLGGFGRNPVQGLEMVDDGASVGEKRQGIFVETAEFLLYGQKQFCIVDRAENFPPVPDDAVESHQLFNLLRCYSCHLFRIETMESFPVAFAFPENRNP